ncbi:MAG: transposase [Bacteroidota bacterium]
MNNGLYQNKYRIASARWQNWDYRWNAAYFITGNTKNRVHYFGEIVNKKMQLSNIGVIADIFWHEIKNHAKHVELGAFVVMPNHLHGILILNDPNNFNKNKNNDLDVETRHTLSLESERRTIGQKRFQNQGKNSVSSIIGSYKSAISKHAHRLGFEFDWQGRFHDHVIRDKEEYQRIHNYIINNPEKWEDDKFYDKP